MAGFTALVAFAWRREDEYLIPAAEVARLDRNRRQARAEALELLGVGRVTEARDAVLPEPNDPHRLGHSDEPGAGLSSSEAGPASKRVVTGFGFWVFLLSDIVMFSALFATYAVWRRRRPEGPGRSSCSTRATWRSKRSACCCRVSPAVSPRSPRASAILS